MMSRRMFSELLFGSIALVSVTGCNSGKPDATFRYRMTVEVQTPSGVRTGSSVRQLSYYDGGSGPSIGESRPQIKLAGEAIAVDLPNGQTLFALLKSDDDIDYAARIADRTGLWDLTNPKPIGALVSLWPRTLKGIGPANASSIPMLVTFKNTNDPKSVKRVDPDDLSASFGAGYKLRSITAQITNEQPAAKIQKRLAWLSPYPEPSLDPSHGPYDWSLLATTHHRDFRQHHREIPAK